ncbi:putative clathrin assembly protein At1g33340 [Curcuma longa]|uniref:putative clathrin assembly protein At1g33340 n=1 Tax=Curcuma longa TaxID=136217 RepID=UPI003D9ED687
MKVKFKLLAALSSFIDQATGPRDMAGDRSVLAEIDAAVSRCIDGSKHGAGEERVHEILFLVSNAPGSITFLSRRLSARLLAAAGLDDDAAAVKTLLLLHRLLRGGDRYFEQDLRGMWACGELKVDLAATRCAAERNGFLLGYAAFLEERLGWAINPAGGLRPTKLPASRPPQKAAAAAEWVLYSLRKSQTFLDRAMDCLPENTSAASRAMQSAFNIVVRESIRVYESFSEEVEAVIAAYPELDERSKSSAAEILRRACAQTPSLYDFYESCKRSTADVIGKSNLDYPYVRIITAAEVASIEHRSRGPTSSSGGCNRGSSGSGKESSALFWKKLETTISTVWVVFEEEGGGGGGSQTCRSDVLDRNR